MDSKFFKRKRLLIPGAAVAVVIVYGALILSGAGAFRSANDILGYLHEAALIGACSYFYYWGFGILRKKRLIENTPTSKIRSVAMGMAEVAGVAREKATVKSPFTLTDCVYYRFLLEKETRDSKGRTHWSTVKSGSSTNYFYADDGTGRLLIDPLDAETELIRDYHEIKKEGFGARMRYSEWHIKPGDYVYAHGTVKKFRDNMSVRNEKILEKLRQIKADVEKLKAIDTNKDGAISPEEWDAARSKAEQEVLEEEINNPEPAQDDIVLTRGEIEEMFIIADQDEKELAKKLAVKGFLSVFASGLVMILMFGSLMARLGILPEHFAIPWQVFYK